MEQRHLLGHEIRIVSNLLKRNVDKTSIKKEMDSLTGTQSFLLGFLFENRDKDIFQKDIEAEFSVRRSTVTGILKLMEKNDLITRESVSYDARLKKIVLTKRAQDLHNQIDSEILRVEARLAEGITEEEKEVFFRVINKMKQNINET